MEFIYSDLGYLFGNEIIEVTLDAAANVCLLDSNNFYRYKNGYDFDYRGGYVNFSPYQIAIPYAGKWFVTIDLGEYGGNIGYTINVIKPEALKKNQHFNLPNRTTIYFDELPEGRVKLTSVIRDGISRSIDIQIFNSVKELYNYCNNHNWSKY